MKGIAPCISGLGVSGFEHTKAKIVVFYTFAAGRICSNSNRFPWRGQRSRRDAIVILDSIPSRRDSLHLSNTLLEIRAAGSCRGDVARFLTLVWKYVLWRLLVQSSGPQDL